MIIALSSLIQCFVHKKKKKILLKIHFTQKSFEKPLTIFNIFELKSIHALNHFQYFSLHHFHHTEQQQKSFIK